MTKPRGDAGRTLQGGTIHPWWTLAVRVHPKHVFKRQEFFVVQHFMNASHPDLYWLCPRKKRNINSCVQVLCNTTNKTGSFSEVL